MKDDRTRSSAPSPIDRATDIARARYDRIAALYDLLEAPMEHGRFTTWRQKHWAQVRGPRVLEVGVGTGKNFPYYPEHVRPPKLPGVLADLANPLVVRLWGANINRCTVQNVERAGLRIERVENLWDDVVKLIVAQPSA